MNVPVDLLKDLEKLTAEEWKVLTSSWSERDKEGLRFMGSKDQKERRACAVFLRRRRLSESSYVRLMLTVLQLSDEAYGRMLDSFPTH